MKLVTPLLTLCTTLCFVLAGPACGEEDDNGDSGNDSNASMSDSMSDSMNDGSGGMEGESGQSMTSSSMETCMSDHSCINGVCECETPGAEGEPCEEDTCEEECEVCM